MKNLIIIGARGFGREVHSFSKNCLGYGVDFQIKGFLDDDSTALDNFPNYSPILSSVESYEVDLNDVFICALGSVKWSKHYTNIVVGKNGTFINLIHNSVEIRDNVKLGCGIIIGQNSIISTDIIINDFTQICSNCVVGHDVKIGTFCRLGDFVFLGGFVEVGDNTFIAVKSLVLANLKIGNNAIVGAGSVVIRNVKDGTSVFGNPAKKIEF